MSQTLVMRDRSIALTEVEKASIRKFLTKCIHGVDEKHHKRWLRVVRNLCGLEPGEIEEITTRHPRSGPFHRFHMVVETSVFNAQEKFVHLDQFRNWLKVGAGHVDWVAGPKGGVVPLPKSISYADLEEPAMREFHDAMMAFLRGEHAAPYLWKHLGTDGAAEMMRTVLLEFE